MNNASIGNALAESRKRSGISQHDMGKKIGVTQARVSQFEQDAGGITLEKLSDWYHAVGTDGKVIIEKMINDFFIA